VFFRLFASSRVASSRVVLAVGMAAILMAADASIAAAAEPPTYRTIAPIQARPKHGETRYRANVQALPAQPYAWGWFGARPRTQPAWQRGYYGDLRFWSRTGW
jgi:hypothetical protein